MRIFLSLLLSAATAVFVLLAGLVVAGAGHGWNNGFSASVPMCAVSAVAMFNSLRRTPSRRLAVATLALGCIVLGWLVLASFNTGGSSYLPTVWSRQRGGLVLYVIAMCPWFAATLYALVARSGAPFAREPSR